MPENTLRRRPQRKNEGFSFKRMFVSGGFDVPFLAVTIVILTIGLVMLFSASYAYAYQKYKGDSFHFIKRQFLFAVLGMIAMFIVSKIDYHIFKKYAYVLYGITFPLLLAVFFLKQPIPGFYRWFQLGPINFQPSDVAKFTVVVMLARIISENMDKMKTFKFGVLTCGMVFGAFCGLILAENHLSATILIAAIGATMMFVGGTKPKYFLMFAALGVIVILAVYFIPGFLDHSKERLVAWLDKEYDPKDTRWQINNALYAIGSGGLFGTGLGNSKQKFLYVSEPQNDFIFAIVCEELGFIGAAIIICLFIFLIWRGFQICVKAPDKFGSLLVVGIIAQIGLQVFLNIAVITEVIPNTGISFPFFSYGGTSLMMLLFEIGVVLSVSRQSNIKKV